MKKQLISAAMFFVLTLQALQATENPVCPAEDLQPVPAFASHEQAPNVASWRDLAQLAVDCHVPLDSPAPLTVALAGHFDYHGSVSGIATRLGAISHIENLPYWSVTDNDWRPLISEAFALDSANPQSKRTDFTADELLNGQTRYFAQNDTRSWGQNIYRLRVISSSADHLILVSDNVTPVKLGPVTLFKPHTAVSVQFINRTTDTRWSYYNLAVIKESTLAPREKSLINRQAAFYRYLIQETPTGNPPLAK